MSKIPVIFIMGAGHSGSTLLNLILDTHSRVAGVSEYSHYSRWSAQGEKCACGLPVGECPFWKDVFSGVELYSPVPYRHAIDFLLNRPEYRFWDGGAEQPLDIKKYMASAVGGYRNLLVLTNKQVIVDASKMPDRAELLARHTPDIEPIFVHLVRDGRGVTYSNIKIGRPAAFGIRHWLIENIKASFVMYRNRRVKKLFVHYEDLATHPERELTRILTAVGLVFEPAMLTYAEIPHHSVVGNPMRLESRPIQLDTSWYRGLAWPARLQFILKAGWLNKLYRLDIS